MIGFLLVLVLLAVLFARVPVIRLYEARLRRLNHALDNVRLTPAYRKHVQATLHGIGLAIVKDETGQ
ncbi:MAG: hypothetical protein FJX64_00720 [Alphaproteobacteria bacterium]|nr:hypothetical protein [Alphaproteobacteria bacterium]